MSVGLLALLERERVLDKALAGDVGAVEEVEIRRIGDEHGGIGEPCVGIDG